MGDPEAVKTPSFHLAACPICSSLVSTERPMWRLARHTSAAKHAPHYFLVGCKHVAEVSRLDQIRSDPDEWALIEGAWADRAEKLMEERTERWTPSAKDGFKRAIEGRAFLPGMTAALVLEEAPAKPEKPIKPHPQDGEQEF